VRNLYARGRALGRPGETDLHHLLTQCCISHERLSETRATEGISAFTKVQGYFTVGGTRAHSSGSIFEPPLQPREAAGCECSPSAGIIDSQSIKTTESDGPRGYNAPRKSTEALYRDPQVGVVVHPTDIQDRDEPGL
jgi:hypothetical protein